MRVDSDFLQRITDQPWKTVADYYATRLPESPKAVTFIETELGLSLEQAALQRIGFSDRTLGKFLPTKDSQTGRDVRDTLVRLGLLKATGHEALRGCVTIPLLDDEGNTTGIHGRRIDRHGKGPPEVTIGEGAEVRLQTGDRRPEEEVTSMERTTTVEQITTAATESTEPPSLTDASDPNVTVEDDQVIFTADDRRYRVRGLEKNTTAYQLKVNLMASRDSLVHLDSIDLAKARSRRSFVKAAAAELFVDEDRSEAGGVRREAGAWRLEGNSR